MRLTTILAVSAVALASAGYSQADEVYQGIDTAGHRIKVTISDGASPEVLVRVDRRPALPEAHWTALIGTGAAAEAELRHE